MGCRQSHNKQSGDFAVESLQYRKRSSKFLGSKAKKLSKKSNKSACSAQSGVGATELDGDAAGMDRTAGHGLGQSPKTPASEEKGRKNVNERLPHIFGSHKPSKNGISLSVDLSNASGIEARHARFGNSQIFPVWDATYHEPCSCVNLDSNQEPPDDDRRSSSSTVRLCRRCSQTVLKVHNKRGSSGSNKSAANNNQPGMESAATSLPAGGDGANTGVNEVKEFQIAAIANLLALAALDLSAPASSLLVKNRKNAWIQLAGHPGAFAPAGPNSIWKKRIAKENYETLAYQALSDYSQSTDIIPAFHREVEFNGEYFIEMEDLLHHFNDPSIMDIKMGTRTFLEAEVKNPVLRKDLFEKMIDLDPDAPTADEKEKEAITKLRYMQFREHESSTANLGFRIEAIRMSGEPPNTNLKKVKTQEQVSYFIQIFTKGHSCVIPALRDRLRDIRQKFESIPFFKSHEIIGSSLLVMFDSSNQSNVWMIDFAKTIPVPDLTLNHRSPWQLGNHEDGYLYGLDHLIEIFDDMCNKLDIDAAKSSS